jgi:hypothetical protein
MLKNITFTAEEAAIERAREQAKAKGTTLNELVRAYIEELGRPQFDLAAHEQTMKEIRAAFAGKPFRKYTREEMNARRY